MLSSEIFSLTGLLWLLEVGIAVCSAVMASVYAKSHGELVARNQADAAKQANARRAAALAALKQVGPVVPLINATGILAARGHSAGIANGLVLQTAHNATRGTFVVGPPGSGKSFTVIGPWVAHFLEHPKSSMFGFGVKPSWTLQLIRTALHWGRNAEDIVVLGVGPGRTPVNVLTALAKLSPVAIGSVVEELITPPGSAGENSFWGRSAAAFVRDVFQIAQVIDETNSGSPFRVTIVKQDGSKKTLAPAYTFDFLRVTSQLSPAEWTAAAVALRQHSATVAEHALAGQAEDLGIAIDSLDAFFAQDAKLRTSILSSVTAAVSVMFNAPHEFRRAFMAADAPTSNLSALLDNAGSVIVDIDLDKYTGAGKLVYQLLFAEFRQWISQRERRVAAGDDVGYCAFVADEYPAIARASDLVMANLCRASNVCGIYGVQSLATLKTAIGDGPATAFARSMGTTILLPGVQDPDSLELVDLGQVDRVVKSYSRNVGQSTSYGGGGGSITEIMGSSGTSSGESWSTSLQQQHVLDPQVRAQLRRHLGSQFGPDQWTDMVVRTYQSGSNGVDYECAEIGWMHGFAPSRDLEAPPGTRLDDLLRNRVSVPAPAIAGAAPAASRPTSADFDALLRPSTSTEPRYEPEEEEDPPFG